MDELITCKVQMSRENVHGSKVRSFKCESHFSSNKIIIWWTENMIEN